MAGKGSKARPFSVSQEKFAANWDAIFGKKDNSPKNLDSSKNNQEKKKDS